MRQLHKPEIAILASGSGSTAEAFIHATQDGRVDAEVGLVISDVKGAGVFDRVQRLRQHYKGLDIRAECIDKHTYPGGGERRGITRQQSEAMAKAITREGIGHVSLMGFMQIVNYDLLDEFGWQPYYRSIYQARALNTHPASLPYTADTWGIHASQRVLDLGLRQSAHTVHLVSERVDEGPVYMSTPVDVESGDSAEDLFARVQIVEKAVLPLAIDRFLKEQARYRGPA